MHCILYIHSGYHNNICSCLTTKIYFNVDLRPSIGLLPSLNIKSAGWFS